MAYGLEPKRIFWWVHREEGKTHLDWVTIKRVDHWHGRITFDFGGEAQETDFSELEVSLFRRYPLWDPERECYLADRSVGWETPPKPSFRPAGRGSTAGPRSGGNGQSAAEYAADQKRRGVQSRMTEPLRRDNRSGSVQKPAEPERDPGQVQLRSGMRLWYLSEDRKSCSMITVQQVFPASQEMTVVIGGNTLKLRMSALEKRISVGCPRKENDGLYVPDRAYTFTLTGRLMKEKIHG